MMSRLKTRMLTLSAIVLISAGVYSSDHSQEVASNDMCMRSTTQINYSASEHCKLEAHTSWYAWLTGGSSSAQFHYLDLLELLIGSKDTQSHGDDFSSL